MNAVELLPATVVKYKDHKKGGLFQQMLPQRHSKMGEGCIAQTVREGS